jgi:hypothetical protein
VRWKGVRSRGRVRQRGPGGAAEVGKGGRGLILVLLVLNRGKKGEFS